MSIKSSNIECYICGSKRCVKFIDCKDSRFPEEGLILKIKNCLNCRTLFLYPRPPSAYGKEYFNRMYSAHNKNIYYNEKFKRTIAVSRLNVLSKYRKFNSLLEIGCGKGAFLREATKLGVRIGGVEINESAREQANNLFGQDIVKSRIEDVNENFDLIVLWDVIEHLNDPVRVLGILRKYLNKNGTLILRTGNADSVSFRKNPNEHWMPCVDHKFYFSPTSIKNCLGLAGFNMEEIMDLGKEEKKIHESFKSKRNDLPPASIFKKILKNPFKLLKTPIVLFHRLRIIYFKYRFSPYSEISIMTVAATKRMG